MELSITTMTPGTWRIKIIDSSGGQYTSLALDAAENSHISYYDGDNVELKYTTQFDAPFVIGQELTTRASTSDNLAHLYSVLVW